MLRNNRFLLSMVVLVALGALVVASAVQFRKDELQVASTHQVLEALDHIQKNQERASSQVRGYLLTGQQADLAGFRAAEDQLQRDTRRLQRLVAESPSQSAQAQRLQALIVQRLDAPQDAIERRRREGAAAVAAVDLARVHALQSQVNALIDDMHAGQAALLQVRAQRSSLTFMVLACASLLGIPLSLLLMGYTHWRLQRENRERMAAQHLAAAANSELSVSLVRLHKLSVDLECLTDYAGMLQGATTTGELYQITEQVLHGLFPKLAGSIFIGRTSSDNADLKVRWGIHAVPTANAPAPGSCWAIRRNLPFFVDDASKDMLCEHARVPDQGTHASACIPLSGQGDIFGWLYLSGPGPGPLEGVGLAVNACEQLSLALANMRLRDSLRHQAIRDPLTGLFNRRYLEEGLERELSRCRRRNLPLAVMMLDVDHFKQFNDRYGHAGGDAQLAAFGALLKSVCRGEDIPCRMGGEEFALVLPELSLDVASQRAEEIRQLVQDMLVSHLGEGMSRVTVSIGLALMSEGPISGGALLQAADAALYRAKHSGRNRVEIAR